MYVRINACSFRDFEGGGYGYTVAVDSTGENHYCMGYRLGELESDDKLLRVVWNDSNKNGHLGLILTEAYETNATFLVNGNQYSYDDVYRLTH